MFLAFFMQTYVIVYTSDIVALSKTLEQHFLFKEKGNLRPSLK